MNKNNPKKEPIFILGIRPRSGTNFLYKLIDMHPQCQGINANEMPEDFLLFNAKLLIRYVDAVLNFWNQYWQYANWRFDPQKRYQLKEELCTSIGDGLISYLEKKADEKVIVTKTPSVENLKYFFDLFPHARLLILTRDGRAVVESSVKSFSWSYEFATQKWAEAARNIIEFDQEFKDKNFKYLIVKYENLVSNLQEELTKIFDFLELDINDYNLTQANQVPILGSSESYQEENIAFSENYSGWKIVNKSPSFNPNLRFSNWSKSKHRRFNWIAGSLMEKLSYKIEVTDTEISFLGSLFNKIRDKKWQTINLIKLFFRNAEKTLYAISLFPRYCRRLKITE